MRRGFTLLEVLIACAILAGGIVVVTTAWSGNLLRFRKATLYNNVTMLLERKIVEIEAKYKDKPMNEITDESGDFGSELPQYRWEFKTHDFQMPDLTSVIMGKEKQGQDENFIQLIRSMQDYMSKSVKEGQLTVFVKSGKVETPFTISTYFVSYTEEMELPGVPKKGP